ncbi:MAG: indolepyruvate oxidoreductase subunit beta [Oscillospiraceae bacterium]|jgi:indolepyruvate ferredoxin oxidoreductase beta subunit|nr:indolepyruvate oxidoreductase subunit beta [Oscillospiraceae bacterium]
MSASGTNILLAGVGGQGVVLASKILARCAAARGEQARTSETIGMAQRGGSVTSHVRLGECARAPLIPRGGADVIIGFEPAETARSLGFLKPGGAVIVSDRGVYPSGGDEYDPEEILGFLRAYGGISALVVVSADAVRRAAGSYKPLNVALLGAAAGRLGISEEEAVAALRGIVSSRLAEANLEAWRAGAAAGEKYTRKEMGI